MNPSMSFLDKVLHPPSSVPGFVGLPTNDARSQVIAEYRNLVIMKNPSVQLGNAVASSALTNNDLTSFDVAFLVPNGARVLGIAYVYNTTTGLWYQDLTNTDIQDVYNFDNWKADSQLFRPCYKSLTTYLNATAFNNTGSVAVSSFNPALLFAGTLMSLAHTDPMLFADFVASKHEEDSLFHDSTHENYSIGIKNFMSFPLQAREDITKYARSKKDVSVALDPATSVQILSLGDVGPIGGSGGSLAVVPSTSMILNQSQRSYAGKACEGTFSVSKFNTIAPKWMCATNGSEAALGHMALYECHLVAYRTDGTRRINVLKEPCPPNTPADNIKPLMDTQWTSDMTMTWIKYEGLTFNPAQTQNQLLIRKYYSGIEIQPALQSAWAGMQKAGPTPDLKAMQAIMDGFYTLKDGMPAKYNFLGTLGSIISSGLGTFGTSLLKQLATQKGLSIVSGLAKSFLPSAKKTTTTKVNSRTKDMEKKLDSLNKKLESLNVKNQSTFRSKRPVPARLS